MPIDNDLINEVMVAKMILSNRSILIDINITAHTLGNRVKGHLISGNTAINKKLTLFAIKRLYVWYRRCDML